MKQKRLIAFGFLAFFVAQFWLFAYSSFIYQPAVSLKGAIATMEVQIVDEASLTESGYRFVGDVKSLTVAGKELPFKGKIMFFCNDDSNAPEALDFLLVKATLNLPEGSISDLLTTAQYYRTKGIFLTGGVISLEKSERVESILNPYKIAINIRQYIRNCINKYLSEPEAALANSILLGDKTNLDDNIAENFRISGLSHALAVSGMHVSFLCVILVFAGRLLFRNRKLEAILGIVGVWMMCAITAFTPSVVRAGIMCTVVLLAQIVQKEPDTLTALGLSAAIITLVNPYSALDAGLLLSVSAVLGMVLFSGKINSFLSKKIQLKNAGLRKGMSFLTGGLSVCISASIFSYPILAVFFGDISLISPLANILCILPVQLVFIFGICTVIVSPISPLASFFAFLLNVTLKCLIFTTDIMSKIPFATIFAGQNFIFLSMLFIILIILIIWFFEVKNPSYITIFALALLIGSTVLFGQLLIGAKELKIYVLDSGQGDFSLLVKNGGVIVIDAGGSRNSLNIFDKRLKENFVNKVEVLVITHMHDDHYGYTDEILQNYKVENLILPSSTKASENAKQDLILIANERGTKIFETDQNDYYFEALQGVEFKVLGGQISQGAKDDNDNSLLVHFNYEDFQGIIAGDMTIKEEKKLSIYNTIVNFDCDFFKVSHHGSNTSNSDDFLNIITPKFAVITVGKNNIYSLPDNTILDKLKAREIKTNRTDEDGEIFIKTFGSDRFIYKEPN